MEKHYTLQKAAQLLGVTTQTLRNWDNAGKIRTIRTPGNQRRIPESEITRFTGSVVEEFAEIEQKPQRSTTDLQEINEIKQESTEIKRETAESIEETAELRKERPDSREEIVVDLPPVIKKDKDSHILMCKDVAIYDITASRVLDESLLPGCMLNETKSFSEWMETRYSRETNFSSERLMQRAFGKSDHEHAMFATGALSLSDCYWIKEQEDDIRFMDVTPYIHKEWDGIEATGIQNDYIWGSLSNLFVGGKTDKRWCDASSLLKINSFNEVEPYNLCIALGLENITKARETDDGTMLTNFTSPDIFLESMEQYGIKEDSLDLRDIAVENFKEHAVALFVIDYLVENNDRHADDYGFLRNSATGEYISMAPYFNFDWVWTGEIVALPDSAWLGYHGYIHELCRRAISVAGDFEYGTIIERRAGELLRV